MVKSYDCLSKLTLNSLEFQLSSKNHTMDQDKEKQATKKTKKKKIDYYSKLQIEDFEVPPHFPDIELAPSNMMERPLVTRAEWGADPAVCVVPLQLPVNWVLFTYTETEECTSKEHCLQIVKRLQLQHMQERGLPDIQYNFLAGHDFNLYEGRGWTARPDKNERFPNLMEKNVIEFAYIGNFKDKTPPMELQVNAWNLIEDSLDQMKLEGETGITDDFYDPEDLDLEQVINMPTPEADACQPEVTDGEL